MPNPHQDKRIQALYSEAMAIIDEEWLAEGVTRAELDREEQLAELYCRLAAEGRSDDEIQADWAGRDPDEILRSAAEPLEWDAHTRVGAGARVRASNEAG